MCKQSKSMFNFSMLRDVGQRCGARNAVRSCVTREFVSFIREFWTKSVVHLLCIKVAYMYVLVVFEMAKCEISVSLYYTWGSRMSLFFFSHSSLKNNQNSAYYRRKRTENRKHFEHKWNPQNHSNYRYGAFVEVKTEWHLYVAFRLHRRQM